MSALNEMLSYNANSRIETLLNTKFEDDEVFKGVKFIFLMF